VKRRRGRGATTSVVFVTLTLPDRVGLPASRFDRNSAAFVPFWGLR
jgi:hypothetical protein